MSTQYFGGIEGGATHSKLVICDENGTIVSKVVGPGTNHWVCGIPEVAQRIAGMIEEGKSQAKIDQTTKFKSLGLSLSGCEQTATNKTLENELLGKFPDVSESVYVCSDTIGSLLTASPLGGMVLIAGTGSNALLRNPDGATYGCGGWGNFLADESSAYWISHRAIKTCFDDIDGLVKSPHDISIVWDLVKLHFKVDTQHDLLDYCYAKFDKAHFASLCEKLSKAAVAGDRLSLSLFEDAGRYMAKSVAALLPKVNQQLVVNNNFNIVCVGSVFKSWHLLKNGFVNEISKTHVDFGISLISLTQPMAMGAVYVAADSIQENLPRDYSHNFEIFFHYSKQTKTVNDTTATLLSTSFTNGLSNGIENNRS